MIKKVSGDRFGMHFSQFANTPPFAPSDIRPSPPPHQSESQNNENVDVVNRRVTMTPNMSPAAKKKTPSKTPPTPVVEESSGHNTDASDEEYWAKKSSKTKTKPSAQLFSTGTAVTKGKKLGSVREFDKDSKLYTVLFENGDRKTFKEVRSEAKNYNRKSPL